MMSFKSLCAGIALCGASAIAFAAGAVSVVAIVAYGKWMKHQGRQIG